MAVTDSAHTSGGNTGDGYTASSILNSYIENLDTTFEYSNTSVGAAAVRTAVQDEYADAAYDYDGESGSSTANITVTDVSFVDDYEAPGAGGEKTVSVRVTLSVTHETVTATQTVQISVRVTNTNAG